MPVNNKGERGKNINHIPVYEYLLVYTCSKQKQIKITPFIRLSLHHALYNISVHITCTYMITALSDHSICCWMQYDSYHPIKVQILLYIIYNWNALMASFVQLIYSCKQKIIFQEFFSDVCSFSVSLSP